MKYTRTTNRRKNKQPNFDWRTIFVANAGGFSSKRVLGVFGFLTCLGLLISGFIMDKEVPQFADMVIITSSSLIGIDAFRGIFSRNTSE